ncbi:MAG: hypothetical protein K2M59_09265 [Muribaculaceae bacterium]|nr:hypothetical protein [Muribaculaceae bacterium]
MKFRSFLFAGLGMALTLASASSAFAQDKKFMRSSIYSILVNSKDQNTRLDQEAQTSDAEGYAEAIKSSGLSSLGEIPGMAFPKLTIPEQFNDHNLNIVVVDFDALANGISEEDAAAARPKSGGAGKFLKAAAADAVGPNSSMVRVEKVDDYMHAVLNKFFEQNNTAPMMVAKWYDYDPNRKPQFDEAVIMERGLDNASAAELAKAAGNDDAKSMLSAQGFDLMNNTYVVATNLRFRNNKALAKEISDLAAGAVASGAAAAGGGALGGLAAMGAQKAAEAAANALLKDMYSVTAVTNLYKLVWNDDIADQLADKVLYNENATIEDLLNSGVCKLEYVGQTKARSGVKKDKTKTLSELAESATGRAIDKALAKLQAEHEGFRTVVPVSKCDNGFIYAKMGTKEGIGEGDEFEILEQYLDKNNKIGYKKVGSAKVEKGGVWFNTTGADELIANADEKEAEAMKAAQALDYTKLKGPKKDFSGYYLRLSKKKAKIQD